MRSARLKTAFSHFRTRRLKACGSPCRLAAIQALSCACSVDAAAFPVLPIAALTYSLIAYIGRREPGKSRKI